jgi:CubicO group peptidase (beta-lactamase class C family)
MRCFDRAEWFARLGGTTARHQQLSCTSMITSPSPRTRMVRLLVVALLTAAYTSGGSAQALPAVEPGHAGFSAERLERIRPALQELVDSGRVAGVVAVLARDGEVVYQEAIGRFDSERPQPLTTDHLFRIYSMTKPVTAVAILKLQEQGKLDIDDAVSKYIPAFADVQVYAGGPASDPELRDPARPPTIADLMSHTAGLSYGAFGNTAVDSIYTRAGMLDPAMTLQQFADSVAKLPLLYSPGERWVYSVGLDVAGRVVEVASGLSFEDYLGREIFEPLDMDDTGFFIQEGHEERLMPIHSPGPSGRVVPLREIGASFERTARFQSGGGGLISSAGDYLRFAQMLANGGELDGVRILSPGSVELMRRNHLPEAIRGTTLAGPAHGFGLAVAVQVEPPAGNILSSEGTYYWAGLANTNFWIDPDNGIVGLSLTQQLPSGRDGGVYSAFRRMAYEAME